MEREDGRRARTLRLKNKSSSLYYFILFRTRNHFEGLSISWLEMSSDSSVESSSWNEKLLLEKLLKFLRLFDDENDFFVDALINLIKIYDDWGALKSSQELFSGEILMLFIRAR